MSVKSESIILAFNVFANFTDHCKIFYEALVEISNVTSSFNRCCHQQILYVLTLFPNSRKTSKCLKIVTGKCISNVPFGAFPMFPWFILKFNPLSANPTKWSNTRNLSANYRRIVWVCLTILWYWGLKNLKVLKCSFIFWQDRANMLFKQVHDQKSLKGRSNDAISSACLYIACRQEGVPRTFKG